MFSGDGTYNEVINGLRADIPVGFIPGGGTSVLPRALGLPRDPARAAERIAHGKPRRISLGRINGRRFAFNAGIGFDAELVRRVDGLGRRADGKRPGDVAFAWTVVRTLSEHRLRYEPALEVEGLGRAAFALVANCSPYTYAGRLGPAVRARRLLRGRPRHRRAGRGARPGDPAPRRAGAARTARAPATCCSATTSTGS